MVGLGYGWVFLGLAFAAFERLIGLLASKRPDIPAERFGEVRVFLPIAAVVLGLFFTLVGLWLRFVYSSPLRNEQSDKSNGGGDGPRGDV